MNECQRIASQLERALNGGAWYGPSWREALEGVTREAAVRRPIADAHSIAEIALHTSTWQDVVRQRLRGEKPNVTDADDWKAAAVPNEAAWAALVASVFDTGRALKEEIERFPAEKLEEQRPGVNDTWYALIVGEMQHVLYHAGQVGLIKKAGA
jgi:hypothetical protein